MVDRRPRGAGRLCLTRRLGEAISIGEGAIIVTVIEIQGTQVKLSIEAPKGIKIDRIEDT
jgi:carbon storage regulator